MTTTAGGAVTIRNRPHLDYALALERNAAAIRRLVDLSLRVDPADPVLGEVADALDELSAGLESPAHLTTEQIPVPGWRHNPVSGEENGISPPLRLESTPDGSAEGIVTLGVPYQGPNGIAHGGVSAMILDQVLSAAIPESGVPIVTARLTIRFHRPVPLFTPLAVRGRVARREGRKVFSSGEIMLNDTILVSAEGLFVEKKLSPEHGVR